MQKTDDATGLLPRFKLSPLRDKVLGEVHARPFRPMEMPRTVLQYAFLTTPEQTAADRAWFSEFCASCGAPGPRETDRYHTLPFGGGILSWERHTEFVKYTWDGPGDPDRAFGRLPDAHPFGTAFRAPGDLLVAVRVELRADPGDETWRSMFDDTSLSVSVLSGGNGRAATDFRQDGNGLTRILVLSSAMTPIQAGTAVLRILEVETYRTLATLGYLEANKLQPDIARIETSLAELTAKMQEVAGLEANRELLDQLTGLAAALEASATASTYRFGATRAYYELVKARLRLLEGNIEPGELSLSTFLTRRLAPAMRTCLSLEDRQAMLSRKLARATTLLRTRVDVDLEQQNRNLLDSMNRRARLQLRLQQTVEGLSVAAVSYYVVGLISYLAKGAKDAGLPLPAPNVMTGLSVPVVVFLIWFIVKRIRAKHTDE